MSIEKNNKNSLLHEDGGFTTTLNSTIQNIKHTGALGLYCYLASLPTNWEICKEHLQKHFGCGKAHINTCFKYLKEIGAIEVIMNRNGKGQSIGWSTILKRRINVQYVHSIQNTRNQHSGDLSRIPKTENLGNPESGKSAIIKETTEKKERVKEKTNKEAPVVSVFSDSVSVRSHIALILKNRNKLLTEDLIDEILHYIGDRRDFDEVVKLINISLKLIKEKRWNTPKGYNKKISLLKPKLKTPTEDDFRKQEANTIGFEWVSEYIQSMFQLDRLPTQEYYQMGLAGARGYKWVKVWLETKGLNKKQK
jgi:hypothetical protein